MTDDETFIADVLYGQFLDRPATPITFYAVVAATLDVVKPWLEREGIPVPVITCNVAPDDRRKVDVHFTWSSAQLQELSDEQVSLLLRAFPDAKFA